MPVHVCLEEKAERFAVFTRQLYCNKRRQCELCVRSKWQRHSGRSKSLRPWQKYAPLIASNRQCVLRSLPLGTSHSNVLLMNITSKRHLFMTLHSQQIFILSLSTLESRDEDVPAIHIAFVYYKQQVMHIFAPSTSI